MPQIEHLEVSPVKRPRGEAERMYDRLSSFYDFLAASSEDRFIQQGVEMLDLRRGDHVLEIGFGTGRGLVRLAGDVGPEGRIHGVDLSEGMAEQARKRLEKNNLTGRVKLLTQDAVDLPFGDDELDAAFTSFTLELFSLEDIERVLGETWRVVRENGKLMVVSLHKGEAFTLPGWIYEKLHELFPRTLDCRPIPTAAILRREGWLIDRQETGSMWGLPVSITLARKADNRTGK